MFDIGSTELLLIIVVAVIVIGPKELPHALYKLGQVLGKARGMARHFRTGIDAMIREAEMEDLEKKWAAENRRIMAQYPNDSATAPDPADFGKMGPVGPYGGQQDGKAPDDASPGQSSDASVTPAATPVAPTKGENADGIADAPDGIDAPAAAKPVPGGAAA